MSATAAADGDAGRHLIPAQWSPGQRGEVLFVMADARPVLSTAFLAQHIAQEWMRGERPADAQIAAGAYRRGGAPDTGPGPGLLV